MERPGARRVPKTGKQPCGAGHGCKTLHTYACITSLPAPSPPIAQTASLPPAELSQHVSNGRESSHPAGRATSDPATSGTALRMRPKGRIDVGGATAASGKMATWKAVLVAAACAPLRGRLAGLRLPRSQRRLPSWRVAAAAMVWGGSLAACYSGRTGVFPMVLAQVRWQQHPLSGSLASPRRAGLGGPRRGAGAGCGRAGCGRQGFVVVRPCLPLLCEAGPGCGSPRRSGRPAGTARLWPLAAAGLSSVSLTPVLLPPIDKRFAVFFRERRQS